METQELFAAVKANSAKLDRLIRIVEGNGDGGVKAHVVEHGVRLDHLEAAGSQWRGIWPQIVSGAVVAGIAVVLTMIFA